MTDVHSKKIRSYNMSMIKGKNTKPEMLIRSFLHSKGFRYRIHDKHVYGKPDLVLKKHKAVVFINGCFWHAHDNCRFFVIPKTRQEWWTNKLLNNRTRDLQITERLKSEGWNVITIWECEIKADLNNIGNKLINALLSIKKS